MDDLISRQAAIEYYKRIIDATDTDGRYNLGFVDGLEFCINHLSTMPSAEPERLTDDDFETIRIHLSAIKEKLCNQHRWKEAEEYQRIIDRFMSFASAQPERKKGKWIESNDTIIRGTCSCCGWNAITAETDVVGMSFCPNCGADMREEKSDAH